MVKCIKVINMHKSKIILCFTFILYFWKALHYILFLFYLENTIFVCSITIRRKHFSVRESPYLVEHLVPTRNLQSGIIFAICECCPFSVFIFCVQIPKCDLNELSEKPCFQRKLIYHTKPKWKGRWKQHIFIKASKNFLLIHIPH